MQILIKVTVTENFYEASRGNASMDIAAPIDLALNADWGEIVQMLIQQAHDSYLENVAGEGGER